MYKIFAARLRRNVAALRDCFTREASASRLGAGSVT